MQEVSGSIPLGSTRLHREATEPATPLRVTRTRTAWLEATRSTRLPIRTVAIAAVVVALSPATYAACLTYTTPVRVEGTLVRKEFPGPPMYESVADGDTPETMWLLRLDHAVCISADPKDRSGINAAVRSLTQVQLVLTEAQYRTNAKWMGQHVVITGKFFGAVTAHHHTPVLLDQVQFVP